MTDVMLTCPCCNRPVTLEKYRQMISRVRRLGAILVADHMEQTLAKLGETTTENKKLS